MRAPPQHEAVLAFYDGVCFMDVRKGAIGSNANGVSGRTDLPTTIVVKQPGLLGTQEMSESPLNLLGAFVRQRVTTHETCADVIDRQRRSSLIVYVERPVPTSQNDMVTRDYITKLFGGSSAPASGLSPDGGTPQPGPHARRTIRVLWKVCYEMLTRCRLGTHIEPAIVRKFVFGLIHLLPLDVTLMFVARVRATLIIRGGGVRGGIAPTNSTRGDRGWQGNRTNVERCVGQVSAGAPPR